MDQAAKDQWGRHREENGVRYGPMKSKGINIVQKRIGKDIKIRYGSSNSSLDHSPVTYFAAERDLAHGSTQDDLRE